VAGAMAATAVKAAIQRTSPFAQRATRELSAPDRTEP
jgi:hypothetical protein